MNYTKKPIIILVIVMAKGIILLSFATHNTAGEL